MDNNIFYTTSGEGYLVNASGGSFASLRNNLFYHSGTSGRVLLRYDTWNQSFTTAAAVNGLVNASGNLNVDPALADATSDWTLTSSTPASVTGGGIDGSAFSWGFTFDKDNATRTGDGATGWSMGAYEY